MSANRDCVECNRCGNDCHSRDGELPYCYSCYKTVNLSEDIKEIYGLRKTLSKQRKFWQALKANSQLWESILKHLENVEEPITGKEFEDIRENDPIVEIDWELT